MRNNNLNGLVTIDFKDKEDAERFTEVLSKVKKTGSNLYNQELICCIIQANEICDASSYMGDYGY